MRWGFLGIGRVTPRMVEAVHRTPRHHLQMVAARDPDKLQAWMSQHHAVTSTTDFDALINDGEVDAVYIALPPSLHAEWACRALRKGKVVLCEKPLACSLDESTMIQQCAAEMGTGVLHATAFPFHPRSRAMRDVVRSGRLGRLARVTIACSASHILHRGNDHRAESAIEGGCLLDLGWYCVYATLWLTGRKPLSIRAQGRRLASNGVWISCQAIVELEDNAIAIWDCGFDAAGRKWIEVAGSEASMICDDFLRPWDSDKPRFWIHGQDGKASAEIVGAGAFQESEMLTTLSLHTHQVTHEAFQMALDTQRVLHDWELAMNTSA